MAKGPSFGRTAWGLLRGRTPGQLIIQMTDKCNARCPQCDMRVTESYERSTLGVDDMRRAIDAAAEKGMTALSFTGGEPLLMLDEMVELIKHAGDVGIPYIRSGTNGYVLKNPDAPGWEKRVRTMVDKLASTPIRNFWISIDSADSDTHEKMRGFPRLMDGIEKAIPIFREAGIYPSANLGINRNVGGSETWDVYEKDYSDEERYLEAFYLAVRRSLRRFYNVVRDMGFTIVNTCYPMSIDSQEQAMGLQAVYGATSLDRVIKFTKGERAMLFKALFNTVPEFRTQLRIFSPRSSLLSLYRQYHGEGKTPDYGCRGGVDFFFINSVDGNTYPCGYRGNDNMGKFEDLDLNSISPKASCTDCDWECFRDPSELAGPLLEGLSTPVGLARRFWNDREYARLWLDDILYYRACEFFNGRQAPNLDRLQPFKRFPRIAAIGQEPALA